MVDKRYRAFISYSHRDREAGERLHRKLEAYPVPSKLVGAMTREGSVPRRVTPIFRDREDLPTSGDLSASVETALERSRFLIVLCSPAAAASEWVNKEVARFKKAHGEDRVLGVIIDNDSTAGVTEPDKLFPKALRFRIDADGEISDAPAEPLAADMRETGDGDKFAFLKIVAGLLGVGLDDLVQRDQNRRNRNMKVATGGLSIATLAMAGLTWFALDARSEAQMQRREAEGLVEFMLTDLRDNLEAVGRLDALDSTGEKLLQYYAAQNPDRLDAVSLSRRAKAQILVGDIDQRRNELDKALTAYEAAAATTQELLSREPHNPDRIFDHAQSVFYVGYIAHQRGDLATAETHLSIYLDLANKLVAIDQANPKWRMELAFATSNLGVLEYARKNWADAVSYFNQSAAAWRVMRDADVTDDTFAIEYAYALSWLALVKMEQGEYADARDVISEQLPVYAPIIERRANDTQILDPIAVANRRLAEANLALGDVDAADAAINAAKRISDGLVGRDTGNAFWKRDAAQIEILRSQLAAIKNNTALETQTADRAVALAASIVEMDASETFAQKIHARALTRRVLAGGDPLTRNNAAARLLEKFNAARDADQPDLDIVGGGGLALGSFYADAGDAGQSAAYYQTAYEILANEENRLSAAERFTMYRLCKNAFENTECAPIANSLQAFAFRHPMFVAMRNGQD